MRDLAYIYIFFKAPLDRGRYHCRRRRDALRRVGFGKNKPVLLNRCKWGIPWLLLLLLHGVGWCRYCPPAHPSST